VQAYRRGLIPQLGEERRWPCAVRQCAKCPECVFSAAGQSSHHVIGIDPNTFQLGDELSNDFRVRHPAPDWGWRRRFLKRVG
jgi:hypothetical protein